MTISSVIIEKPSKIHNLSYFILGYYITTLLTPYLSEISFQNELILITTFGSFLGTIIYYIKPFERIISTYYRISGKNEFYPPEPYDEFKVPIYKSDLLYSRYLNDERVKINGAFFLSLGMFFSKGLLNQFGFIDYYPFIIVCSLLLICVGIWEIYLIIKNKMDLLIFYYGFYNESKKIEELSKALELKDWNQAKKITESEWYLWDPDLYVNLFSRPIQQKSICPKCSEVREGSVDEFCIMCGTKLIQRCPNCNAYISTNKTQVPKFCKECGSKIYQNT